MGAADTALPRTDYRLDDALWADHGQVFLTGTQALVRLLAMQQERDAAAGLRTAGFVSGYRGSPLGGVDQQLWKAQDELVARGIRFVPAVNEELGATAVLGTQRVEADPARSVDGVYAMWYGKGPGVDRAGDALKHGNAYGSSAHGGVLVVAGDDPGCVSSSMPHQSDFAMQAWSMPVVAPADVAEVLEFGLYGWALSRFSGAWVGLTALSEVIESGSTVDLDALARRLRGWRDAAAVCAATGYRPGADGLHTRWPDLPSLAIEARLADKLAAVRAFARVNAIDRLVVAAPAARVGIVTVGKAHHDLMEVLRRLEIPLPVLDAHGVRVLKLGLAFPIETGRVDTFARGLDEILVVEEKGAFVETQLRAHFYNRAQAQRPAIVGKTDRDGRPLLPALGETRPSRLIEAVAAWLAGHEAALDRRSHVVDFTPPRLLSNEADAVRRVPYFCAGCPHNTSTRVPEGSRAQAGIGCHFMATWMQRSTEGLIQMGGEGVDWVSHAMFTREPHVFQNLGDGTYYHSGYLAIRQAVAAGATLTYKILYNDAVAMTGGQPVEGKLSVDAIARQVEAEGVVRVAVVSDDIGKYADTRARFPAGTSFDDRAALDRVQRELRATPGVTVLIYEQTCAAEKRRRRRKGELADPERRLFIHPAVCEGCGDCSLQSNCVAVQPLPTPLGRKRRIDQSSCNKDFSCLDGFCPSFVGVRGARIRKRAGALVGDGAQGPFLRAVQALPEPPAHAWDAPWDLLVTGVGGTGVVTVGALVAMAANLEGKSASVLDFMGFAQKGGSVLAHLRFADRPERLNQVRIDAQQADAVLACDLVVGASAEALQTVRHGRTRVVANVHPVPVAASVRDPDAELHVDGLLAKLQFAAGQERVETLDAQRMAEDFLGDTIVANILCLGYAWQRGLVPLSLAAMHRAIELNGVAVHNNLHAFALGRLAAHDPAGCRALLGEGDDGVAAPESLETLLAHGTRDLAAYQDAAWAARWRDLVEAARAREAALGAAGQGLAFTRAVAASARKLMTAKDEYEVARLFSDPAFDEALAQQFEGDYAIEFYLAPPWLARPRDGAPPRKRRFGAWLRPAMRWLARARRLRGTVWDPFGYGAERRTERGLVDEFEARVRELLAQLDAERLPLAVQIAMLPQSIRGFGHVKLANLALARAREAELLHRFAPARYAAPPRQAGAAPEPVGLVRAS